MNYRREIDGLRALAVLPVILFHTGFSAFSGGFVGVDVFFVISGYLITKIILEELEQEKFSIVNFYERRARRILPALFLVMFASLVFGYILLMPDEFKNLGQSLVATSLFSNNILLGLTSGYWDLASEFKPLLHTWSLSAEEQYYAIVPILLMFSWRFGKGIIIYLLWVIFIASFLFAIWFVNVSPKWAFYILPARAWEICIGALASLYMLKHDPSAFISRKFIDALSLAGFLLIAFSIVTFDKNVLSPSWPLLVPAIGTVLIIIFCQPESFVFRILGGKIIVFFGLISYSLYLWHQPVFAFLRAYSAEQPKSFDFLVISPLILLLSVLTWKFIEIPFRNRSIIGRKFIFTFSISLSALFVAVGLYLNKNYGMPLRFFDANISIKDMDKRIYNENIFSYKKDGFSNNNLPHILVVGNSYARDFINITIENFDVSRVEIVYRDDFKQCINSYLDKTKVRLFAEADIIIFANGSYDKECYLDDIAYSKTRGKNIFYIGIVDFGYNLNWLARLNKNERRDRMNFIPASAIDAEREMSASIPEGNYISLLKPVLINDMIPITDELGRMLSTDRIHLSKFGALYFGKMAIAASSYAQIFK